MLTELVVAAAVLTAAVTALVPLIVQQGRLLADARRERTALDELSNQLDRLTLLPAGEARAAMSDLTPSEATVRTLGEAKLAGELVEDAAGARIVLTIAWDSRPGASRLRTLTAWLVARAVEVEDQDADAETTVTRSPPQEAES